MMHGSIEQDEEDMSVSDKISRYTNKPAKSTFKIMANQFLHVITRREIIQNHEEQKIVTKIKLNKHNFKGRVDN